MGVRQVMSLGFPDGGSPAARDTELTIEGVESPTTAVNTADQRNTSNHCKKPVQSCPFSQEDGNSCDVCVKARPHVCVTCSDRFAQLRDLKIHKSRRHKPTHSENPQRFLPSEQATDASTRPRKIQKVAENLQE